MSHLSDFRSRKRQMPGFRSTPVLRRSIIELSHSRLTAPDAERNLWDSSYQLNASGKIRNHRNFPLVLSL
jgi:hypothetical protein